MKLKIVTPERVVVEEENVDAVFVNAVDGEIGILPRHIPLVTPLAIGVLRYEKAGEKKPIAVMGGLLHMNGDDVAILTDAAERSDEIDTARATVARERAEALLRQQTIQQDTVSAKAALARSMTRLKASRYSSSSH